MGEGTIERMKSVMVQVGAFSNKDSLMKIDENLSGVENVLTENGRLQKKLNDEIRVTADLRKKVEDLNIRINGLNTEKQSLQDESGKLTELIIKLKTEIQTTERENAKFKDKNKNFGFVLDSSKRDLVEKLSKAIETIEILSKENTRLVELNNRGSRYRKDSGSSSTKSMPIRNS